jgi:hypothetical protein
MRQMPHDGNESRKIISACEAQYLADARGLGLDTIYLSFMLPR